jgi:paired amphipathic helix protein Sin3a
VYNYFIGQVLAMVEGTLDNTRFEEFCRSLLGNKSYVLYTLDKVVAQAVKHLQVRCPLLLLLVQTLLCGHA